MYGLSKENFKIVEKLVVVKGENYNQDRCLVIQILDSEITCCMDEIRKEIRICQINGQDAKGLEGSRYVIELIKLATGATYTKAEEKKYSYYMDEIKMTTECCEMNCNLCKSCPNKSIVMYNAISKL